MLMLRRSSWPETKTFCGADISPGAIRCDYGMPYTPPKGLPRWFNTKTGFASTYGFIRSPSHPILRGLRDADLRCWAGTKNYAMPEMIGGIHWPRENVVSLDNLRKPSRGLVRCLVDAGYQNGMDLALLTEVRHGRGTVLLSSLLLAEKCGDDPAAARVLANCLAYLREAKPTPVGKLAALSPMPELAARGLEAAPAKKLAASTGGVSAIEARRADWEALGKRSDEIRAFVRGGGTLYVHRLTPKTARPLSDLLGVDVACTPTPAVDQWWLDPSKIACPRKGSALTEGLGNFDMNWSVFVMLIYGGIKVPDPLVEYVVATSAADAEELTEAPTGVPACALLRIPFGRGQVVVDQVLWDRTPGAKEYVSVADAGHGPMPGRLGDVTVTSDINQRKAGRYIATLMTNILSPIPGT
jgi:hypothetical protein